MKEAEVVVTLCDGSFVSKKWEEPCHTDMPELIQTLKRVKDSLNDYLTDLIVSGVKDQTELSDTSDLEEDVEGDSVSGFIKDIASVNEKSHRCEKRKINYFTQAKKPKKSN